MNNTTYTRETIILSPYLDIGFVEVTTDMVRPYIPFHWHDAYELIYVTSGTVSLQNLSRPSSCYKAGDIVCTDAYLIHDMQASPDSSFIIAMVPYDFVQKYIPDIEQLRFKLPHNTTDPILETKLHIIRQLFQDMLVAVTFKEKGYILRFQGLLFELLFQIYHSFSISVSGAADPIKTEQYQRLQTIVSYVHENYSKAISLKDIAEIVHLQPQYFCHYFKRVFGKSFFNYIYEIRLCNIETDLAQTDLPIGFIAENHGFVSLDLFRKKFYEKNHCTPTAFRKKNRVLH